MTKAEFFRIASEIAASKARPIEANFKSFLSFAFDNPTMINPVEGVSLTTATSVSQIRSFLDRYISESLKTRDEKITLKSLGTFPDPVVDIVMEVFGKHPVHLMGAARDYHRLSMAAENKVGELLERYLANALEPMGWFWCACNIIRGVDFFKSGNPVMLLQVKNRSNSENSSSSAIRATLRKNGCPVKIAKWHRIDAKTGKTNWGKLPGNSDQQLASEPDFHVFIRKYLNN